MVRRWAWAQWTFAGLLCFATSSIWAQQGQNKPQDNIPDAPSATRPPQPFPAPTAPASPSTPAPQAPEPTNQSTPAPEPAPASPPPAIKAVPQGGETNAPVNTRDEIYTLSTRVNFVAVPVTVKDKNTGRLVEGLLPSDFEVLENGVKQKLTYFTSDPFFLSAAVIVDLGMSDTAVKKVQQSFSALLGSFSQYDQVSLYTFSDTVGRITGFSAVNQRLSEAFNQLKNASGRNTGVPVVSGPLASGPTVNNQPLGGTPQPVYTPPKQSHVLNDAILRAALDLSKQDRTRRKVIFVVSSGRELGSTASYADTLKVLLSNQIAVYAIATDSSAVPVYNKLSKLHIPRFGYDNLLPKYSTATGGEVFTELSPQAIETAYASAMGDARNQYTLGYQTKVAQTDNYRDIEVRVDIPNLDIHAKAGYYPLPPERASQP